MRLVRMHGARDHRSKWRLTIPLQDGRECPECKATVCSWPSWQAHREWHQAWQDWSDEVNDALEDIGRKLGLDLKLSHDDADESEDREPGTVRRALAQVKGIVIGAGELPPELRGGDD